MREALLRRVLPVARAAAAAARGLAGGLGALTLLALLAAGWLAYLLGTSFNLAGVAAGLIFVLLAVPAFMLGLLYFAMRELIDLPLRMQQVLSKIKGGAQAVHAAAQHPTKLLPQGKVAAVREFAKLLVELRGLGAEVAEVFAVLRGAALIANPVFALIAVVTVVEALILILAALITAIVVAL